MTPFSAKGNSWPELCSGSCPPLEAPRLSQHYHTFYLSALGSISLVDNKPKRNTGCTYSQLTSHAVGKSDGSIGYFFAGRIVYKHLLSMGWRQLHRRIFYQYNQQSLRLGYEKNKGTQEEL